MGSDDAFNLPPPNDVVWLRESMAQDAWERRPENIDKPKRQLLAEYRPSAPAEFVRNGPRLDASTILPGCLTPAQALAKTEPTSPAEWLQAMGVEPTGWRVEVLLAATGVWAFWGDGWAKEIDAQNEANELNAAYEAARVVPYWTIVGGAE